MKKTLMFAGVFMALGAGFAAEVAGNNTAVVIRKTAVNSSNKYQFLCAPVAGFDITGTESEKPILLEDILPAATAPDGAEVTVGIITYVPQEIDGTKTWVLADTGARASSEDSGVTLTPGTVFWVKNVTGETIFCGQDSDKGIHFTNATATTGIVEAGNADSNAISIQQGITPAALGKTFGAGSQLLVVEEGKADYKVYFYDATSEGGCTWTQAVSGQLRRQAIGDDVVIEPGEAFYLYMVGGAQQ